LRLATIAEEDLVERRTPTRPTLFPLNARFYLLDSETNIVRKNGFTLIELLIALVIIAILASIAIPSYESYLRKGRRVDAKNALSALQLAQEKYRGNNTAYSNSLTALGLTATSPQGYYSLTISAASGTGYTATATVNSTSAQAPDAVSCPSLSVTQTGYVVDATASCWGLQ
jgi:type IV pilus assembly protein PilE